MRKRMVVMLLAVAAFVAAIGGVKFRQIQAGMAMAASFQPPPEAVTTAKATREEWPSELTAIGTVAAARGVTLSADLPGVVESITFQSGAAVRAGQVLVRLDSRQEEAQLTAAESQLRLSRLNLDRAGRLTTEGIVTQAEHDRAHAEHAQAAARVGEIRATIARKTIRAPFSGILGIRHVDLGEYLSPGNAIVALQAADPLYVDFAVPQQDVPRLRVGSAVTVTAEGLGEEFTGRITALDAVVDPATRNVQVQATLPYQKGRLRPGMFVDTRVVLGATTAVVSVPASSINYAPYGDSVFVVGDLADAKGARYRGVKQQLVKLGPARGDRVAVASGLEAGQEIVTSGVFKLRNGAAVRVENAVPVANDAAPRPENN